MNWWFTSDTHFDHAAVIRHSRRPFASVEEMNETIIERWNDRVKRGDHVVHCGDFSWSNKTKTLAILRRLNGCIHLIRGNHDKTAWQIRERFASFGDIREFDIGRKVVACHYSMRTWNKAHYGAAHVYGHSHGSLGPTPGSIDVGVDTNDFRPYAAEEVLFKIDTNPWAVVDHHAPTVES